MTGISRSMTSQSAKHACPSHIEVFLTAAFNVRSKRTENKPPSCWFNCRLGSEIRLSEDVDLFELTREEISLVLMVRGGEGKSPTDVFDDDGVVTVSSISPPSNPGRIGTARFDN